MFSHDIILMVGIPLSGKSTLSRQIRKDYGHVIICPDNVRLAIHGNQFIQTAEPFVWAVVETMVRTMLLQDEKIIIDATNTHFSARSKWIRLAKEMKKSIVACVFQTPYSECIERNKKIKRLDQSVIDRMINQFKPPTYDEGFDSIFNVTCRNYKFDFELVEPQEN